MNQVHMVDVYVVWLLLEILIFDWNAGYGVFVLWIFPNFDGFLFVCSLMEWTQKQDNFNTQLEWVPQNIRELNRKVDKLKKNMALGPMHQMHEKKYHRFLFQNQEINLKRIYVGI